MRDARRGVPGSDYLRHVFPLIRVWDSRTVARKPKAQVRKLPRSASADPIEPRTIPLTDEPASSLTGFGFVSLADTALKLWDDAAKKPGDKPQSLRRGR